MKRLLAGHPMEDGPGGLRCTICSVTWLSLLDRRDQWQIGNHGIAHSGALNSEELKSLTDMLDHIGGCVSPTLAALWAAPPPCPKCSGTGKVYSINFGMYLDCDCQKDPA